MKTSKGGDGVLLATHNYTFVSEKTAFYEKFDDIFMLLKNAVIEQVYALWDCIDNRWFDEMEIETIKGLNWIEDLEWRADDKVSQILNEQIDSILFHHEDIKWGIGIGLKTKSGKCLWIYDVEMLFP